jgi:hypothetical protein
MNRRPPNAGKGRPKGSKNKVGVALKDMILQALANVGGEAYLQEQAAKNATAFMQLVGRVLPLQVKETGAEPMVPKPVVHVHED